jgi:hypothetical protein
VCPVSDRNRCNAQYSVKLNLTRICAPVPETVHDYVFLTQEENSLTCRVCPFVRDLLHLTKLYVEQYSSYFTDLFVQRELVNFRLAEGGGYGSLLVLSIFVYRFA